MGAYYRDKPLSIKTIYQRIMCINKEDVPIGNNPAEIEQRQAIILQFYREWKAANPTQRVYNNELKDYINIRKVSISETARHAAKTYLSTLAVMQLDGILACAKKVRIGKPKARTSQSKFQAMIEMEHDCPGVGRVKLTVGVKLRTHIKIQYCITAIDIKD
ncbi:MAG: hypothetical protein IKN31_08065 [Bacteroidales bacterium]|nr:hypothetical protein [Bacteroidales bacterium]